MSTSKKKAIALPTVALGAGVLAVAAFVLYRPVVTRYWLWKLNEGTATDKERAAERLADLKAEAAVPILIEQLPQRRVHTWHTIHFSQSELDWSDGAHIVRALANFGAVAVPQLRVELRDKGANLTSIVHVLGEIGPAAKEAVPDLLALSRREGEDTNGMLDNDQWTLNWLLWVVLEKIDPRAQSLLTEKLNSGQ